MKIQDGVYDAHLVGSEVRLSNNGKPMICFLWKLDESGETIKSYVHLCLKDGSPNTKGVGLVKSWAADWNGEDLYWFSEHLETASKYDVKLTIVNEPGYDNPSVCYSRVKWVNAAHGRWGRAASGKSDSDADVPIIPNREEFHRYLDTIHPTMKDVWMAFKILYRGVSQTQLEKRWFELVDGIRDGKDIDQFTATEWHLAIVRMAAV